MKRTLALAFLASLAAMPAPVSAGQAPGGPTDVAPHLMNSDEFLVFLKQLDKGSVRWEAQLRGVDVKSVAPHSLDGKEMERSYQLSLQSLAYIHEEVQGLLQKQTLRHDFLLLVDLNDLARNLDGLDRDLANPDASAGNNGAQKSLRYAREVLGIDAALAPNLNEFQRHILAFAGVIDANLEQPDDEPDQPLVQE